MKYQCVCVASCYLDANFDAWRAEIATANVVVVVNASRPTVAFLAVEDMAEAEACVLHFIAGLTVGCNYRYHIVARKGETFICN